MDSWKGPRLALVVAAAALCAIYLPDIGHGFVRDDFMWIRIGRIHSWPDVRHLLGGNVGFYRPVVSATFALNYALSGLAPLAYGLTNLLLLIACAVLIVRLAAALGLHPVAAATAGVIWVFNFHAVSMALLWLSGRTALLVCLFGLLMALAVMRGRRWMAATWCCLALLSQESAVAFPFAMAAWTWHAAPDDDWRHRTIDVVARTWPLFLALAVYLPLRQHAGAFGPATAPSYYRFITSPALLLRNVAEYADRAATLSVAVTLLVIGAARRRPTLDTPATRAIVFGAIWLVAGYAITVLLPVRSDLYALNPSVGAAIAAGGVVHSMYARAPVVTRRALIALLILPFLLLPVYRARNRRWVMPADLSSRAIADLETSTAALPDGSHLVLVDDRADRANLSSAFGDLLADAIAVSLGRGFTAEIVDGLPTDPRSAPAVVYRLHDGRLTRDGADVR